MICSKCGAPNLNEDVVCKACGNALDEKKTELDVDNNQSENQAVSTAVPQDVQQAENYGQNASIPMPSVQVQPPVVTPVYVAPVYQPVYPVYAVNEYVAVLPKEGANKLVRALKKLACSPLMIVAAAALTVNIICSFLALINVLGAGETLLNEAAFALSLFGAQFDISSASNIFELSFLIIEAVVLITSLLMLTGIWYTVIQGFLKGSRFRTLGLSIIKGVQITYIVFVSVSLVPLLLLLVSAIAFKAITDGIIGNNLIIMLVMLMIYAIMALIFYSCANGSISAVKRSIKFGDIFGSSSSFVAIASILMALIHGYGIVNILNNGFAEYILSTVTGTEASVYISDGTFAAANVLLIISSVAAIVASVCFGVIIFVHKYKLNKIIDESYKTNYIPQ